MIPSPSSIAVMSTVSYTISTVSSLPSDSPWKQDRLSRPLRYEGTRQTPVHQFQQRTNSHWSAYDSHHPQSVKRSVVKRCMTERSVLWQNHQSSLRKRNICHQFLFQTVVPPPLYRRLRNQETPPPPPSSESVTQFKSTAVFPHVKGGSEPLRRCIQLQGIRTVFKSDTTLRSHLVRPKDTVNPIRKDNVVYWIARKCSKIYIGEMKRPMQQRMKEHERDIRLARTQTFAVSKHANKTGHHPHWSEVKFID